MRKVFTGRTSLSNIGQWVPPSRACLGRPAFVDSNDWVVGVKAILRQLLLVLYRLPRLNDLRFAHLALAITDEHVAVIYTTTYPLS
jgi:hypothetical protein